MAGKTYSIEYKIQAVKRVTEDGKTASQVSKELGINVNTLREWVKRYREDKSEPFVGSGNLRKDAKSMKELEKRIKELREQEKMTQTELSKRLGITRSAVNAWEMGISVPSTQYILELAELFRVSTDYLLGARHTSSVSVEGLDDEDIRMICLMIAHLRRKNGSS